MTDRPVVVIGRWRPASWGAVFLAIWLLIVALFPLIHISVPEIITGLIGTIAAILIFIGA